MVRQWLLRKVVRPFVSDCSPMGARVRAAASKAEAWLVGLAIRAGDREHVTAVGDVAAVYLRDARISEHLGDHRFRVMAVVCLGCLVYPTPAVIAPQHLRSSPPVRWIVICADSFRAGRTMRENGADLSVRAWGEVRFIAEKDQLFAGQGIAKAAPQRLATRGSDVLDGNPGCVDPSGAHTFKHYKRDRLYLKSNRSLRGHAYRLPKRMRVVSRISDMVVVSPAVEKSRNGLRPLTTSASVRRARRPEEVE